MAVSGNFQLFSDGGAIFAKFEDLYASSAYSRNI